MVNGKETSQGVHHGGGRMRDSQSTQVESVLALELDAGRVGTWVMVDGKDRELKKCTPEEETTRRR